MPDCKVDLEASARDFIRGVWPAMECKVGGGESVTVEPGKVLDA